MIANVAGVFALTALLYYLPQYLQLVLGLSPVEAALALVPGLIMSIAAGYLDDRIGAHRVIVISLVSMVVAGFVIFALHDAGAGAFWGWGIGTPPYARKAPGKGAGLSAFAAVVRDEFDGFRAGLQVAFLPALGQ